MKKMLLILMLGLTLTGCGKPVNENEIGFVDNIAYRLDNIEPYTGKIIGYYENGKTKYIETYKNGILHGEKIIYYENGNVKYKKNYKLMKLDGEFNLYEDDGSLYSSKKYNYGKIIRQ